MMDRVLISSIVKSNRYNHAGSKAREDIDKIFQDNNFEVSRWPLENISKI